MPPIPASRRTDAKPTESALTLESLVPYLLRHKVLKTSDLVDGPVEIQDRGRRNRNFKVIVENGSGLLVKQVGDDSRENTKTLRREADWLRAVATKERLRSVRWLTPQFEHHDPSKGLLITRLVHPATTLRKYHLNAGDIHFPLDAAVASARLLAGLHRLGPATRSPALPFLEPDIPFAWTIRDGLRRDMVESSAVMRLLARQFRDRMRFYDRVPQLVHRWQSSEGVVHGDARWDNFLLTHGSARGGGLNLRLVDWEHVRKGDSAWDLAYYLADYIRFWLDTAAVRRAGPGQDVADKAAFRLPAIHDSTRTFWRSYCRGMRATARRGNELWTRVLEYLPFNLAALSYESIQPLLQKGGVSELPGATLAAVDMAVEASEAPEAVGRRWFGIPEA